MPWPAEDTAPPPRLQADPRRILASCNKSRGALLLVLLGCLGACGDQEAAAPTADASAPALVRVREALAGSRPYGSAAWQEDAWDLADALWSAEASSNARDVHRHVLLIAGDVGRDLRIGGDAARERLALERALDLEIHDGVVEALGTGPEAWRSWVESAGAALLARKREALAAQFKGRR